jgi:putative transposase
MAAFDAVDGSPPNRQPVGVGKKEESHGISGYNGIGLTCLALFVPSDLIEIGLERSLDMGKKRPTPEQIVTLLRQIEVATSQGKSVAIACREAGISDQSYYRWRKEYGGLDLDQARRMKDLEKENGRLKRLVADLSLEKPSCGYGFGIYSCGPYLGGSLRLRVALRLLSTSRRFLLLSGRRRPVSN